MKIINSLEHLGVVIYGVTVTVKHKKEGRQVFWTFANTFC